MNVEILVSVGMIILGMVIYYLEYDPVPKNIEKKDLWKFWKYAADGVVGESLIIAGTLGIYIEDHVFSYVDSLSEFWIAVSLIVDLGACFFLPWIVRIIKQRIYSKKS